MKSEFAPQGRTRPFNFTPHSLFIIIMNIQYSGMKPMNKRGETIGTRLNRVVLRAVQINLPFP